MATTRSSDAPRRKSVRLALAAAGIGLLTAAAPAPALAASAQPIVFHDYDPNVDNTLPYFGCGGVPVMTHFTGWLLVNSVVFPDGTSNFLLKSRELMSWEQDGVTYNVTINFNLVDNTRVGDVVSAVTTGIGSGSDGSRVRHHAMVKLTVGPDGTVHHELTNGYVDCG
jgi:hypothetical protein